MNKTLKLVVFLAIVSAISGLSIGIVNSIAEPIIETNAKVAEKTKLEMIFPNSEFVPVDYIDEDGVVLNCYVVPQKGFVFKATSKGYNSSTPIVALVGLDLNGKVINVIPLEQAETSGVGTKCFDENNINKYYIGKNVDEKIDTITGASFTSKAMRTIITKSQEAYKRIK